MNKIQGLLDWCKYHIDGYPNVSIKNFTSSWKSGLAFNALIHRFKPELVDFHGLDPENEFYNNYTAFQIAENHFGIPSLLDAKDMALTECPERLSIITYVSQFYNCLKEMEPNGGPMINKFENTNNYNSNIEGISSRSSINELARVKCSICRNKVYLLERYVAEDKLYHRRCYRDLQIKTIDNDSDLIGDYLNIYGDWKPSMNKNIFVHPLHGIDKSNKEVEPLVTRSPVNVAEENQSDSDVSDISEEYSESLSSYNSVKSELSDNDQYTNLIAIDSKQDKESDHKTEEEQKIEQNASCQENIVINIADVAPLKPLKTRLYIKKKDKELPYSTFFEVYGNMHCKIHLDSFEFKEEQILNKPESTNEINYVNTNEHWLDTSERQRGFNSLPCEKRKLIAIKLEENSESDLSSLEEEHYEIIRPSIVRNSIWRRPIIFSTSIQKQLSVSEPIETKYKCYSEFKDRLAELNMKQSRIESKGRIIQQQLGELDPTSQEYEELLSTWLVLVEEKDKIFYEENALYSWLKDLKLQEMKENIECQIRMLSMDCHRNERVSEIEKELIKKLIETVNKRSELVDSLHEENVKRLEIVRLRHEALEKNDSLQDKKAEDVGHVTENTVPKKKKKLWRKKKTQI